MGRGIYDQRTYLFVGCYKKLYRTLSEADGLTQEWYY